MSIGVPPLSQYKSVEPSSAVVKCYMLIVIKHQYKYSKPAIHFIKSIITTNIYMFTKSQYLILFLSIRPFEPLKVLVTESWFLEGCGFFFSPKIEYPTFSSIIRWKTGGNESYQWSSSHRDPLTIHRNTSNRCMWLLHCNVPTQCTSPPTN